MSQADTEGSEFCLGDGAERLEIMEARVETIGQVLLQAKICERPLKVLGSHDRRQATGRGTTGEGLAYLSHVKHPPIPGFSCYSARPSTRIGEAACLSGVLDLRGGP
jgi:hypothetical protein